MAASKVAVTSSGGGIRGQIFRASASWAATMSSLLLILIVVVLDLRCKVFGLWWVEERETEEKESPPGMHRAATNSVVESAIEEHFIGTTAVIVQSSFVLSIV